MKLDLACGANPRPGFIGVDIRPNPAQPIWLCDLFAYPFIVGNDVVTTGSVDELFCSHFVEHVPNLIGFMNECYRILKPGGVFTIVHPYQHSNRAWQDPTHVRALNEDSWQYYDAEWREKSTLTYTEFACDFVAENVEFVLAEPLRALPPSQELDAMIRHGVNVVDDLIVTLRARK